ncbi:hypothetical protein [Nocardia transvalensis]|uniref:hypothetical protein n=1 Tax=Nocardia transvalensis TaxID=37333 RepID=UPI001894AB79|nr:hypothetical protein [Nocardia transvalensis]MBF6333144.1 hypothetical protein [Nocardia transvalensis]
MTLGVSTERGTVHAVALADDGGRLPERVLVQRSVRIRGDGKLDLAQAVEVALENLADEIGPDREIVGAAVCYRDAAERRAIVSGLASGAWHDASMVSAKSAHLALARAMNWVDEFGHLVICEVVPGYQAFSLVSPDRDRVVSAIASTGAAITKETMRPAVHAAWDQFDAAGVQPDAVVVIGSAAEQPAVAAALAGFGAPILPCKVAVAAAAIGAALVALPETTENGADGERGRFTRSTAALFAAASVLAGGIVAGGVYEISSRSRSDSNSMLADARVAADTRRTPEVEQPLSLGPRTEAESEQRPGDPVVTDVDSSAMGSSPAVSVVTVDPAALTWGPEGVRRLGVRQLDTTPSEPPKAEEPLAPDSPASAPPPTGSAGAPPLAAPTAPAVAPDEKLLFPGEPSPPQLGTPEFGSWWDNHWRLMMQWASQVMPRV